MALAMPAHIQRKQHQALQVEQAATVRSGMKAPISSAYTGNRAEQVMSGAIMMVTSRSRQWVMERVAITPGTGAGKARQQWNERTARQPHGAHHAVQQKAARGR